MEPTNCHLWTTNPTREDIRVQENFDTVHSYEEDDHQIRSLLRCRRCQQLYFYAFDEEIDWKNGNDPQFRTWIPVATAEEAEALNDQSRLQFAKYSPRLEYAWPSEAESPSLTWIRTQYPQKP